MKTTTTISFEDIPSIPKIVKDFLNGTFPTNNSFVWKDENILSKIIEKSENYSSESRSILAGVLKKQHEKLFLSEKQKSNLEVLQRNNTFTITTGHQLNLFSGPVFFIYKILQTIKSSKVLNEKFPEYNFVPIFWMATEDHDFEEISFFKTQNTTYSFKEKNGGPVGRIVISDTQFLNDFEKEFSGTPFGGELIALMKSSYQKGKSLADATRNMVQSLFSEYGLLILDGDEKALKQQMIPAFQNELVENTLYRETASTVEGIVQQYGKAQVNPREINLFYLAENRNRIVFQNGNFEVLNSNISFTKTEIVKELKDFPEKFSPNALLRPVFQETILPNIAYIGGNAEIAYWLELVKYFQATHLTFPILVPRNSMLFIADKNWTKMQKMQVTISDLLENPTAYIENKLLKKHPLSSLIKENEKKMSGIFEDLLTNANLTENSFSQMLEAEKTRQLKSFDKLQRRLLKAEKIKNAEWLERWYILYGSIHPKNIWQERVWNFSVFYSQYGKDWLHFCYENMPTEKSELIIDFAHSF